MHVWDTAVRHGRRGALLWYRTPSTFRFFLHVPERSVLYESACPFELYTRSAVSLLCGIHAGGKKTAGGIYRVPLSRVCHRAKRRTGGFVDGLVTGVYTLYASPTD